MNPPKLIILRGPSGAGKSTTARRLFAETPGRAALFEQDHYRFLFKPTGSGEHSATVRKLILHNVLAALADGYDVILEGILSVRAYGEVFAALFREHPQHNHLFYFDISLEETLRRHRSRQTANLHTEAEMRTWYRPQDLLGADGEHVILEGSSLQESLITIRERVGW